ncbi:hypothetical protein ACWG8W_10510 [Citricoccus zhacaiensis]
MPHCANLDPAASTTTDDAGNPTHHYGTILVATNGPQHWPPTGWNYWSSIRNHGLAREVPSWKIIEVVVFAILS